MSNLTFLPKEWPHLLALAAGLLLGYVDLHNDEVWVALILLLFVTFIFGLLNPHRAWQWALLASVGLPLAYLGALLAGYALPCHRGFECPTLNIITTLQTFMALVPAFIGAYSGAGLRWGLFHLKTGHHVRGEQK
jgi:ABC-type multidrug transport system permease subunit